MTTRTTRLLALILVSLAACGDDGNPGTNSVCGDGTREGAEQCDDGNTAAGDGCSASCTTELSMSCGNGAVEGTEQCDDGNITSGDGCSATCQTETPVNCGNGMPDNGETCDDGDATGGDGCSATCQTEAGYTCTTATATVPSVCTMATPAGTCAAPFVLNLTGATVQTATGTGNTTASTNQVPMANCDGDPDAGQGKDHVYRFTTTDVRDVVIELSDTNMFDTVLRVMSAPCTPTTEIPSSFATGAVGCADFTDSGEFLVYTALPAGTYYVLIDGYVAAEEGAYTFTVTARPTLCGNGVYDIVAASPAGAPDEECDDMDRMGGDGCSATCEIEPGFTCVDSATPPPISVCTQTCGNGDPDAGETCDDGDTMGGDGCSAVCQTEAGFSCTAATLATPSVCTAIVCGNGINETGETCDDGDMTAGDGCGATCQTESGFTCTVGTGAATPSVCTNACGNGTLQTGEECEDGNNLNGDRCSSTCTLEFDTAEVEPNNTTAQVLTAGSHIIKGSLLAGDVDLYTFTLAAPATVHFETYDRMDNVANYTGRGVHTNIDCFVNDTEMRLFAMGADTTMNATALFFDDNDGDETCSYIGPRDGLDGTGSNVNEGVLAAGTYTIKINDIDPTLTSSRYMLDIRIVSTAPVAPAQGDFVINEIMAADNASDTNCDGSTTDTVDEFIELVNVSVNTLNLAGVAVFETGVPLTARHTFAAGTTVAPGQAIVLWGGGAPACPGVTNFAVAAAGLGLNDDGDTITIRSAGATPITLAVRAFTDAEAVNNVSLNRSPDVIGTAFALHTAVSGAVGAFTPGKKANNTAF